MMRSSNILLPALVAVCHGAALPQSIGFLPSGITIPQPTSGPIGVGPAFTFVIPCAAGAQGCTPRTITLEGRDAEKMPRSLLAREPQSLGSVSRTNIILPTTSSEHHHHHTSPTSTSTNSWGWWRRAPEPQVLGSVSRTNIILPTEPAPPHHHTSTSTSSSCSDDDKWKRQTLGDPTRTNLETPTPSTTSWLFPTTTVTVTVTDTVWPTSSSTCLDSSPASSWTPTTRVTSTGDGSSRTVPILTVPTLAARDGEWATTVTVTVTATSTTSSHHHHHTTSSSDSVIRATVTLPGITLGRRDETTVPVLTAFPSTSTWSANLSGFPGWSWYWPFPSRSTSISGVLTLPVDKRSPQTLGSPTRTEIITPTGPSSTGRPWWPKPTVTVTITKTVTSWPKTTYSPTLIATTATLPLLTLPARQFSIGDPSRTNLITPTPITPTPTHTWWWWPTSVVTITITETLTEPYIIKSTVTLPPLTLGTPPFEKRQNVADSLTRTMLTTSSTSTAQTTLSTAILKKGL